MDYLDIIKEEVNVKEVEYIRRGKEGGGSVAIIIIKLDTEITGDLKLEGVAREIIRHIQEMRKEAGYEVDNRIKVCYSGWSEVFETFGDLIAKETLADSLSDKKLEDFDLQKKFSIENQDVLIFIKK